MPIEASCSRDRSHTSVHQRVSTSVFFTTIESAKCIIYHTKLVQVFLKGTRDIVPCTVNNLVSKLRLHGRSPHIMPRSASSLTYLSISSLLTSIWFPLRIPCLSGHRKVQARQVKRLLRSCFFIPLQAHLTWYHMRVTLFHLPKTLSSLRQSQPSQS